MLVRVKLRYQCYTATALETELATKNCKPSIIASNDGGIGGNIKV